MALDTTTSLSRLPKHVMNWIISLIVRALHMIGLYDDVIVGEFDVVGSGDVELEVGKYKNVLSVRFDEDEAIVLPPCGGGLPDTLDWEIVKMHKHGHGGTEYVLQIRWDVQRPRHVMWAVARW